MNKELKEFIKKSLFIIIAVLILSFVITKANSLFNSTIIHDTITSIQTSFPILAPIVFMLLYTIAILLFIPASIFSVLAGTVFGTLNGTIYVVLAATFAAAIAFHLQEYFEVNCNSKKQKSLFKKLKTDQINI